MSDFVPQTEPQFPVAPAEKIFVFVRPDGTEYPPLPSLMDSGFRPDISKALDRLYRAFSDAGLSADFSGCPHCFTESDFRYVRDTSLSALTHDDLYVIGASLASTLGSAEDIPHFLPRLIEAWAEGMAMDLEPLADRLVLVPAECWTAERLTALRGAFDELFDAGRRDYAEGGPYRTFAEPETREYVRAKLAELPTQPSPALDH